MSLHSKSGRKSKKNLPLEFNIVQYCPHYYFSVEYWRYDVEYLTLRCTECVAKRNHTLRTVSLHPPPFTPHTHHHTRSTRIRTNPLAGNRINSMPSIIKTAIRTLQMRGPNIGSTHFGPRAEPPSPPLSPFLCLNAHALARGNIQAG